MMTHESTPETASPKAIDGEERENQLYEKYVADSRQRRAGCLSLADWDSWFAGSLSNDRLKHLATCSYCSAKIAQAPPPELVEDFREKVAQVEPPKAKRQRVGGKGQLAKK